MFEIWCINIFPVFIEHLCLVCSWRGWLLVGVEISDYAAFKFVQ